MRRLPLLSFILILMLVLLATRSSLAPETPSFTVAPFGEVWVYRTVEQPSRVVILASGEAGWNREAVGITAKFTSMDSLVIGVDTREYLTVKKLAESLACDPAKILLWIHRGELQALNIAEQATGRPRWRIPRESWEAFQLVRSNRAGATTSPTRRRRRRPDDSRVIKFY